MRKSFTIKVYTLAGTYLKTLDPEKVASEIAFNEKINGPQGQLVIDLAEPIDNFGEGAAVDHANVVKVYESDPTNSPTPRLIYAGFVSKYTPYVRSGAEGVKLTCLGLGSLLALAFYKNGASYSVSHSSVDPSAIAKAIIDHFNTVYPAGLLSWTAGDIASVGTNVSVAFTDQKWFDAMKKTLELSGGGRWWRIAADGKLKFKAKPGTATHTFTLGEDLDEAEVEKDNEKVVNQYQLRPGAPATTADFSDATSKTDYGTREAVESDSGITDNTSRDQKGNGKIADNKNPKVAARLRVNANYDLESIHPGDTCSVRNVKIGAATFPTNMLITSVEYTPDFVRLTCEETAATLADQLAESIQKLA